MAHGGRGTVTVQEHCVANDSKKHNRILSAHRNVGFSHKLSVTFKQRSIKVTTKPAGKVFEWLLSSLYSRNLPCAALFGQEGQSLQNSEQSCTNIDSATGLFSTLRENKMTKNLKTKQTSTLNLIPWAHRHFTVDTGMVSC